MSNHDHPGAPEAGPMPAATSDRPSATDPNLAVGGMTGYPDARGGMTAAPMPGGGAAAQFTPEPHSPIGARPEAVDMAALAAMPGPDD